MGHLFHVDDVIVDPEVSSPITLNLSFVPQGLDMCFEVPMAQYYLLELWIFIFKHLQRSYICDIGCVTIVEENSCGFG